MKTEKANGVVIEIENSITLQMVNSVLRCSLQGQYFEYKDFNKNQTHVSCYVENGILWGNLYSTGKEYEYFKKLDGNLNQTTSKKLTVVGPGSFRDIRLWNKRQNPKTQRH
jgi:hypothetical protein